MYILSQVFVIIATLLLGITYFLKNKVKILSFCIFYNIFYGIHYLLLGALTGGAMNIVSLIRNIIFFQNGKKGKENKLIYLIILSLISVIFCLITYKNLFSIISLSASILSTYSVWQDNVYRYKIIAIPVSTCFIIYAIHIKSLFAVITELILLLSAIIGLIKYYKENYRLT